MQKPVVDSLQALQKKLVGTEAALQEERLKNQALQAEIGLKSVKLFQGYTVPVAGALLSMG